MAWKLLVVDDSPEFLALAREVLEEHPELTIVGEANCGEEACEVAEKTEPDAALVDLLLPGKNGVWTTVQLQRIRPGLRVILMSATEGNGYDKLARSAGAEGFLSKRAFTAETVLHLLGER